MVRVDSLSDALGIEILGKAEVRGSLVTYSSEILKHEYKFLNPGGSVKDRVALQSMSFSPSIVFIAPLPKLIFSILVIDDAERSGYLRPHTGSRIFEGTVGSTGISLATIARARLVIRS